MLIAPIKLINLNGKYKSIKKGKALGLVFVDEPYGKQPNDINLSHSCIAFSRPNLFSTFKIDKITIAKIKTADSKKKYGIKLSLLISFFEEFKIMIKIRKYKKTNKIETRKEYSINRFKYLNE